MAPWLLVYVAVAAAAPRIVFFEGRLRGRTLAVYTAGTVLVRFAAMQWLRPWADRHKQRSDAARTKLVAQHGREPTEQEVMEALGYPVP